MLWRGIGGFLLYLVTYTVLGSLIGVLSVDLVAAAIIPVPAENSFADKLLLVLAGIASGICGVLVGSAILNAVFKSGYPRRSIGAAFIVWLVANYALHFAFFRSSTDFQNYSGLVTSIVGSAMTWVVFRLPPFSPRSN